MPAPPNSVRRASSPGGTVPAAAPPRPRSARTWAITAAVWSRSQRSRVAVTRSARLREMPVPAALGGAERGGQRFDRHGAQPAGGQCPQRRGRPVVAGEPWRPCPAIVNTLPYGYAVRHRMEDAMTEAVSAPSIPELADRARRGRSRRREVGRSDSALREFVAAALGCPALVGDRLVRGRGRPWRGCSGCVIRCRRGSIGGRCGRSGSPFVPGAAVAFFTVTAAQEDRFLLVQAVGHAPHRLPGLRRRSGRPTVGSNGIRGQRAQAIHVVTVVRYHRWTGPLYFTVIRPFHHLVVGSMVRAGAAGRGRSAEPQAQNRNNPAPTAAR